MKELELKRHGLKIISILFSFIIWFYVLSSEKVVFQKTIQVQYLLPEDMVFAKMPQTEVKLTLEAPRAFYRTFIEKEDVLVVDLNRENKKKSLDFDYFIPNDIFQLPFGISVQRVEPQNMKFKFDKKASRFVPLKVSFSGKMPEPYKLKNHRFSPAEVEVIGPKKVISTLKDHLSVMIDRNLLMGNNKLMAELNLEDERLFVVNQKSVEFLYELEKLTPNIILKQQNIQFLGLAGQKVSQKFVNLKLLVSKDVLKQPNWRRQIQVWADLTRSNDKVNNEVELKLISPPGVVMVEMIPKSIVVEDN